MTSIAIQQLASVKRPLWDVLVDRLRGSKPLQGLRGSNHDEADDDSIQAELNLEPDDEVIASPSAPLRPDEVAAAIMIGRALDGHRDSVVKLLDADRITLFECPSAECVPVVKSIVKRLLVRPSGSPLNGEDLRKPPFHEAPYGSVAIFARTATAGKSDRADDEEALIGAVQSFCGIIGISEDPARCLPRDLIRMADCRIALSPLDASTVGAVIEAVTGGPTNVPTENLAARVTLANLNAAVRADLGGARSLARLEKLVDPETQSDGFVPKLADIEGLGEAKEWAIQLVADLKKFATGDLAWNRISPGILISGPTGCGKTLLARSIAAESSFAFRATSYAEWQSAGTGHLGDVTRACRQAFSVKDGSPTIVFVDEIDTVVKRGKDSRDDSWWSAINNTILEILDGFSRREGLVVIAACNRPELLDPALKRRLDKHVRIQPPSVQSLPVIIRAHLGKDLPDIDLKSIAASGAGATGADVERWVRDARRRARVANRSLVLDDLVFAIQNGRRLRSQSDMTLLAYHESGHALVALLLNVGKPELLSINAPDGGSTVFEPHQEAAPTRQRLEATIAVALAGRAAEELVFGSMTAAEPNEASDIARATRLAIRIEGAFGLGSLGSLWLAEVPTLSDLMWFPKAREAILRTLDNAHTTAIELLREHRATLDKLASALMRRGYLEAAEIEILLGKITPDEPQGRAQVRLSTMPTSISPPLLTKEPDQLSETMSEDLPPNVNGGQQ